MAKTVTRTAKSTTSKSAASVLGSIGSKPASKAASKTPVVSITDPAMLAAMQAIIEAKRASAEAESSLKLAEGEFREQATDIFEDRCREDRVLHSSVKLAGSIPGKTLALLYTQTSKCCKMKEDESRDPLVSFFAEDFDDLFRNQRTVSIDTSVLPEEKIVALVEAMQDVLGEQFDAAVTVERVIEPQQAFFTRRVLDERIRVIAQRAKEDGYAVPWTPSFKVG